MKIKFNNTDGWSSVLAQLKEHQGTAMMPRPSGGLPQAFAPVEVEFVIARTSVKATGTLINITDTHVAISFGPSEVAILEGAKLGGGTASSPVGDGLDVPLWKRYEALNKAEKIRMAKFGSAPERKLVLKDRDPSLHLHVLNNPGMSANEVAGVLRSGASTQFLKRVTERSDLLGNSTVADALVHNPRTPLPVALKLVGRLPLQTVKRIAKLNNLRTAIVAAARKRVLR